METSKRKKSKYYLLSGISAALALISFIINIIVVNNSPSQAVYEVAEAFGDTSTEDFLLALPPILMTAVIVFIVAAIVLLVVGKIKNKKQR